MYSSYVSLGFSEIDHATLYLAQALIDPTGAVVNYRRKIKPTHAEKLIYGDGSGDTFLAVTSTELGRLGQLNCWENMNPFLKALNVSFGEQIHVAAWPALGGKESQQYPSPANTAAESAADIATPAYAIETGTWVLAPFQRVSVEGLKKNTPEGVEPETDPSTFNGHARIYRPDGTVVAKSDKDFDGLLFADVSLCLMDRRRLIVWPPLTLRKQIDLNEAHLTKALADFAGHYMRPDLIRLLVDTRRKELVTEADPHGGIATYSTRERLGLNSPLDADISGKKGVPIGIVGFKGDGLGRSEK